MALVADYKTDLGVVKGFYPMRVGNSPDNNSLLQFLPNRLRELYTNRNNFSSCRTRDLIPRKLRLEFGTEETLTVDIEIPVTPTLEEVRSVKQNSGATTIRTIGEQINWAKLRWLADVTTL